MTLLLDMVKQEKYFLLAVFVLALGVRLLFFTMFLRDNPMQLAYDSAHYHNVAVSMVQGKGFTNQQGEPYFYRVPGYPLFLAGCYKIFGINPSKALLVQIVLASLIPILLFLLTLVCFPAHILLAKIVSVVSAFHVGLLIFSGLVMTETLFMIMFLLFLILFFVGGIRKSSRTIQVMFLSGLCLGAASLIRPIGLVLVLFACAALYFLSSQQSLQKAIALATGWSLFVGIWVLRNFLLTGVIFLHTLSGPHCINHGAVRVVMDVEQCSWQEAQRIVQQELAARRNEIEAGYGRPLYEIEISNDAEMYAVSVFKKYPIQTAKLCVINMFKTVFSLYSSELLCIDSGGQLPPYKAGRGIKECVMRFLMPEVHDKRIIMIIYAEIIMHLMILLGFFYFCVQSLFRRRNLGIMMLALGFTILFVGLSSLCGFARLRLPIEPFLIMLALMFWIQILGKERVQ